MEMDAGATAAGGHGQRHRHHGLYPASQPPSPPSSAPALLSPYRPAAAAGSGGSSTSSGGGGGGDHRALIRLKRDLAEVRQGGELFTCGCVM